MKKISILIFLIALSSLSASPAWGQVVKEFKVKKQYVNFPIDNSAQKAKSDFIVEGEKQMPMVIKLTDQPKYWVFKDMSQYKGKNVEFVFPEGTKGVDLIYESDEIAGQDSLYKEKIRPQFHFTPRRGWHNDPNGMVYHNGEWHLYFQHNPFESNWENMTWGHAVSKDLVHWTELNDAIYPDYMGTIFSGSAFIDHNNTAGWGKDVMVAAYTCASPGKYCQCIAYSEDNGRTFTKYEGNPVINNSELSKYNFSRDPKVFWYEPTQKWVMVLYEKIYLSIYTSSDLKHWEYQSRTNGFYECPEFYELPVDGDENNKKWVLQGASGSYLIGTFDGRKFTPEYGKYSNVWGNVYAAQTFTNAPDGRRVQIGWGRGLDCKDMPFNQQMLFPVELSLKTTPEGIRLFSEPVREIEKLHKKQYSWNNLTGEEANAKLAEVKSDLLHVKMDVELLSDIWMNIYFNGASVVAYDGSVCRFNGAPYIDETPGSYRFTIEILIDKNSVECFFGNGKLMTSSLLKGQKNNDGLRFARPGNLMVHSLTVYEMDSIWN